MKKLFFYIVLFLLGIVRANSQDCNPAATFNENFDNAPVGGLPACWSSITKGEGVSEYAYVKVSTSLPYSGAKSAEFYNDSSSEDSDIILVSPLLGNLINGSNRLKFQVRGYEGTALQVGTLGSNGDDAEFHLLEDVAVTNSYQEIIVDFTSYTGPDTYIGFRLNTAASYTNMYLDNIHWELNPSCPDVTNVTITGTTINSAVVNWSPADNETEWDVVYGSLSDTDPDTLSAAQFSSVNNTATLNGLEPNNSYNVWVRSVCGSGNGAWIGPVSFTTQCLPTALFNETFESAEPGGLPACWSSVIRGPLSENGNIQVSTFSPYSGNNHIEMYNGNATDEGTDFILVAPPLSSLTGEAYRVKFFASGNAAGLQVGTLNTNSDEAVFSSYQQVYVTDNYTEFAIDFTGNLTENTYLGFKMVNSASNSEIMIDNVRWEIAPACVDVTEVTVPFTTSTTATVNWYSPNGDTHFDVVYSTADITDPTTLAPVAPSPTDVTTTLTGLSADTSYNVWVRSICDEGLGAWIGPVVFHTPCTPAAEFNENFDSVATPGLPGCWSKILRGPSLDAYASIETVGTAVHSVPNAVTFNSQGTTNASDLILVSPNLSNLGAGTHRLKFYGKALSNSGGQLGAFQVGTLDTNTNAGIFTLYGDNISLTENAVEYTIDFTGYLGGTDNFIGIRMNAGVYSTVYLDDIRWELIPPCSDVTDITVTNISTDTATVHWVTESSSSQIVYAPLSATDPDLLNPVTVTANESQITGLEGSTFYKVWVRSVCTEGLGAWIGPVIFTTGCVPVSEINENFDNSDGFPNCWTSILRGPSLSVNAAVAASAFGANSAPNFIYLFPFMSNLETDDIILVSPNLTNIGSGNHQLRFFAQNPGGLSIGTLDTNDSLAIFTPFKQITTVEGWNEYTVDFNTYSGTDNYIGFRLTGSPNILTPVNIDDVVWEPTLSIGNFDTAALVAYPNPVKNILNLSSKSNISGVAVYNMVGQKIMDEQFDTVDAKMDISILTAGNYLVKVTSDGKIKTIKIIKE